MSGRAAAWLAWSLVVLSVVLLVGGLSFALMTRSTVPDGSITLSVLALAFSVVGAIIASRQPRNAIGWIFCGIGGGVGGRAGGARRRLLSGTVVDPRIHRKPARCHGDYRPSVDGLRLPGSLAFPCNA